MFKKKDSLKIELVQTKPQKVYKVEIEFDHQIKELCTFIRNNKDKAVSFVINGKHIKFTSFSGKKSFASGYDQGSGFVFKYAKKLFEEMQAEMDKLKTDLSQTKKQIAGGKERATNAMACLRTNDTVKKLRQAAFADHVQEINDDRALLKERLDKLEPVIKLVVRANTDGQLQRAYKLARKLKL